MIPGALNMLEGLTGAKPKPSANIDLPAAAG